METTFSDRVNYRIVRTAKERTRRRGVVHMVVHGLVQCIVKEENGYERRKKRKIKTTMFHFMLGALTSDVFIGK